MIKALFKLLLIIVALYVLLQIPFIAKYADTMKASLFEKMDNVTEEYDRVKGKVDEVKEKVDQVKEKVDSAKETYNELKEGAKEIKEQVTKTKEAFDEATGKIKAVGDAFSGLSGTDEEAAPDSPAPPSPSEESADQE